MSTKQVVLSIYEFKPDDTWKYMARFAKGVGLNPAADQMFYG